MHIDWMMPHPGYAALLRLVAFGMITIVAAIGLAGRSIRQWLGIVYRRRGPVLLQPQDPGAPGPISVSGLKLRLRLVYDRGPRRLRPVTVYAASGHRGADGRIVVDLLHTVCLTLHKPRTFRVDRILAATDTHGVVIRDVSAWVLDVVGAH